MTSSHNIYEDRDSSIFDPNGPVLVLNESAAGGIYRSTYGPDLFQSYSVFPNSSKIIASVNLGNNNVSIARDELSAAIKYLGCDRIRAVELGNEPDHYAGGSRPSGWSSSDYTAQFLNWTDFLSHNLSLPHHGQVFQAGSFADDPPSGSMNTVDIINEGIDATGVVKLYNQHMYQYSTCDPTRNTKATLPNLVNHQNITAYVDLWKPQVAAARSVGKDFVIGEFSSVSCSGKQNVSDTFGQALWLADMLRSTFPECTCIKELRLYFRAVSRRTVLGFHGQYDLWYPVDSDRYGASRASPSFVAYLLITEAVGSSGNSRISLIDVPEHPQLAIYAIWDNQILNRLVFLNLENRNSTTTDDNAEDLAVSIDLSYYVKEGREDRVKVKRMTAPGIDSKDSDKALWAGQSYANGVPEGNEEIERLSNTTGDPFWKVFKFESRQGPAHTAQQDNFVSLWDRLMPAVSGFLSIRLRLFLCRFIAGYFFLALAHCACQTVLQSMTLADDMKAVTVVQGILGQHEILPGLPVILDGILQRCNGLTSMKGKTCIVISGPGNSNDTIRVIARQSPSEQSLSASFFLEASDEASNAAKTSELSDQCAQSMTWILDIFRDAKREDLATIFFQVWLLIMSMTAVLTDSIPHLAAALASHVLATAWAGFNVHSYNKIRNEYMEFIVTGACNNIDVLGKWWDGRLHHTIPTIISNALVLAAMLVLSWKIYEARMLANHSTVSLQLASFFTIAATALWINKLMEDSIKQAAYHLNLYTIAFAISVVVEIFWVFSGWLSIRREHRILSLLSMIAGIFVTVIWTLMFFSPLYRFVFDIWPFFATMTVTSYIFLVATSVLSFLCRLNFGKGLAHYLMVLEALAGDNFTPASFANDPEAIEWPVKPGDIPRFSFIADDKCKVMTLKRATLSGLSSLSYTSGNKGAGDSFLTLEPDSRNSIAVQMPQRLGEKIWIPPSLVLEKRTLPVPF
ncbi:hypothetical protein EW146_g4813 [Bondarzewia mesenterica]|uniref:Beta-glucuronidase C-terminal domain-containing protein n=1 Tax=Bondarzewia mesenterica TaxID=1095465 RepID=A0A4S4LZ43_9AGAM|nr:hypothetical protein EW146_g4813 [Bondarzewia mesenterica]